MGMLEIRRSSERLDRLGSFRMPELDNGSARAFAAQAEAAKSAAAAARVAGSAEVEGIHRRGQIVARTLGDLGRMAIELANRENERIATNAVLLSENDRNLYMMGNGTPEYPGQFNVKKGKDGEWHAEEWLNDIKKAAELRRKKYTANLNGPQRRIYDEMVAKHNVAWNARIFAHAAKMTLDSQITTVTAALGKAKEAAIDNFDVPSARERSIQAMYEAKEREMNVRQVPESLRAVEMKALTEEFLVNFAKTKFTAWENATAGVADPEAVTEDWNKKAEELKALNGRVIDSEAVRQHLGGYGLRNDGKTYKGTGWLGELKLPNGGVATEYSVGVNIGGKEMDIPTLVPTLTKAEQDKMVNDIIPGNKPVPDEILRKAVEHAKKQIAEGKSVFANNGDTLDKTRQELLTKEFNAHRAAAISRAYALRREAWNAEHMKSLQAEAELRKQLPPEEPKAREAYFDNLAVKYGELADNKELEPSVALRYREAAVAFAERSGKERAIAAKGEVAAAENGIADRLLNLRFAKMNGTISDSDYAEEHAAIWRDFALAWKNGKLGQDFKELFAKDFDKQYDERKLQAMRYVCDLFGYTGKLSASGEVPQGERSKSEKSGATYKTPFEVDGLLWGTNNPTIGSSDLWRILDSTLKQLDEGDKGTDPMEQVKKAAMEYKAGWTQKNTDGMITASAEAMVRAQQQRVEQRVLSTMPEKENEDGK